MSLPADKDVRIAIKAKIETGAPKAIVLRRWTLGPIEASSEWPAILRSANDVNRTHGYVIVRPENDGEENGLHRITRLWTYTIFGLHYYETGDDSLNSEDLFNAELDAITAEFDLVASSTIGGAKRKEPLKWRQDLKPYGGKLHHVGLGTLILEPC